MTNGRTHSALKSFQILQSLGSGGQGQVFLARSPAKNLVAIKVLHAARLPDGASSALSHEGSLAARLHHEAIVQARALLLEDDFAGLVMEFVPGISLVRLLRFATGRGVRVPDGAAWYVVERVLAALTCAHAHKDESQKTAPIVHGDVSPANVILGWDGIVKLGDFGLARMRHLAAPEGPQQGTLGCMAPEHARGQAPTERSDVFSAALLAWRLATGRTPYKAPSPEERLAKMSEGKITALSAMRPDLPALVLEAFTRAMTLEVEKRDVTADDLHKAVRSSFDLETGKKELAMLLSRWRAPLEKTITPWEKQASLQADEGVPVSGAAVATSADARYEDLALTQADDAPSGDPLVGGGAPSDAALVATAAAVSLSRVGSAVPDALTMPPLPPMRITIPSIPVYGGPPVNVPVRVAKKPLFSGAAAFAGVVIVAVILGGLSIFLFRWLSGPN